jgi:hypothetical protein
VPPRPAGVASLRSFRIMTVRFRNPCVERKGHREAEQL